MVSEKMLLHACCGPCSLEPTRLLQEDGVEFSIFYENSNIHPADEYERRLQTIKNYAETQGIEVIEGNYNVAVWEETAGAVGDTLENARVAFNMAEELVEAPNPYPLPTFKIAEEDFKGTSECPTPDDARMKFQHLRQSRCRLCYRHRFMETCKYAVEHGFDTVGTTLSVSPFQYTEIIKQELERACELFDMTCAFVDYRPYFETNETRSKELGMYRQNYCGCRFSEAEAEQERALRKAARKAAKAARKAAKEQQGA